MKTMAPEAPSSQTIARCRPAVAGAAAIAEKEPSAAAVYAITHATLTQQIRRSAPAANSIRVLVPRQQRDRRLHQDVYVEQHRPVLDVIKIELAALLDLFFIADPAAPAVDLRPAGNARLDAVAREIAVD